MTNEEVFIQLLRAGIWGTETNTQGWPQTIDWDNVYLIAKKQTLRGPFIDAVLQLPAEKLPPRNWYQERIKRLQTIAQENAKHHEIINELTTYFEENGIPVLLMKGVSLAALYPHPQYRDCGDIDFYIGKDNYEKAVSLLSYEAGASQVNVVKDDKHSSIFYKDVEIELHRITESISIPIYNRRFQNLTRKIYFPAYGNKFRCSRNNTFPVQYNALYLFNHIWHHFCIYGIGMKQMCDWTLFLHHHNKEINLAELEEDLKSIGLLKPWQMFGSIAVDVLGLPQEEFPFYTAKYARKKDKILQLIYQDGNFGKAGNWLNKKPKNYLKRKFHSLYHWCRRLVIVAKFSKRYALFTTIDYMGYGCKVVWNDITGKK